MSEPRSEKSFGCERCCPSSADAARAASLTCEADLVDEPHFSIKILVCPSCSQRFLYAFTETINWEGGNDMQS
ncbi:MAG: hypothetical protein ACRD2L_06520, partial [Terriglobia bacterium]